MKILQGSGYQVLHFWFFRHVFVNLESYWALCKISSDEYRFDWTLPQSSLDKNYYNIIPKSEMGIASVH